MKPIIPWAELPKDKKNILLNAQKDVADGKMRLADLVALNIQIVNDEIRHLQETQ